MGLRCLVGHDYGEPQTTRNQRTRGNEAVVTVREYRECARCGHQRIISENKEIKAGEGTDSTSESSASPDRTADSSTTESSAVGRQTGDNTASATPPVGSGEAVEPLTAEEDDGIILDDEPERSTRGHGEWPDDGRAVSDDGSANADAEPVDDDAAEMNTEGEPAADPSEPPADPTGRPSGEDAEIIDADAARTGSSGAVDGTPASDDREISPNEARPEDQQRPDDRPTEFVCPECGETWPTTNASLRPGDICPQCHRGYLAEQVAQ